MSNFNTRWYEYIDELERLKTNLPSEQQEDLDEKISELKDLVDEAHQHYDSERAIAE